jgi:hypothetical protein
LDTGKNRATPPSAKKPICFMHLCRWMFLNWILINFSLCHQVLCHQVRQSACRLCTFYRAANLINQSSTHHLPYIVVHRKLCRRLIRTKRPCKKGCYDNISVQKNDTISTAVETMKIFPPVPKKEQRQFGMRPYIVSPKLF